MAVFNCVCVEAALTVPALMKTGVSMAAPKLSSKSTLLLILTAVAAFDEAVMPTCDLVWLAIRA